MPVLMSLSQAVEVSRMVLKTAKASPGPALVRIGREPGVGLFVERIAPPFGTDEAQRTVRRVIADDLPEPEEVSG